MSLIATGVELSFGDRKVLCSLNASFERGESTAIVGPSGSGKSSLLGVIAGTIEPDSGAVLGRERVEWLMQSSPLLQRRRAIDNVLVSALIQGMARDVALLRGLRAMQSVGIRHLARTSTYKLSGGEKQRVAVARAMTSQASLIIADEPSASLDTTARDRVCEALQLAARSGAMVVVATHDPIVANSCDHVFALVDGRLEAGMP